MLVRSDAAGDAITVSEVEPMLFVCWRGRGCLGLEDDSIMVRDLYVDTPLDAAPIAADSGVSGLVLDEYDWNFGYILLSRDADVCTSPSFYFTAIQTPCCELDLAVPDRVGDVFGLAFRGLNWMQ